MASSNPLILVDGSSYLYRAFFASQQADLRTFDRFAERRRPCHGQHDAQPRKQYPDCHVAVVFDAKGKTFRDDIYPGIQGNTRQHAGRSAQPGRPYSPDDQGNGFPLPDGRRVEADDVIGTLARQATEKQLPVLISTGDKDMAQLVSDHVTLIDTMKDVKTDREGVIEVRRTARSSSSITWPDGDKVDNIPA